MKFKTTQTVRREGVEGCRMSYRDELARRYGWPLKIHARGYDAYLVGAQPLLEGGPAPIYRFPGGDSLVDECEMLPAEVMKNVTTKVAMEYIETLHQRSNDARYMSICEKVNEAKRALIKERDELESKCNAYDTHVSLCCERGGSYDAFYSFSDSLYDSLRNEMLKHVDDSEEYEAVYDSIRELSDCDVVAMYIELFEVDEAEVFKKLDSARDELRDAVINEIEYMTDYDENETLHELRDALAEEEQGSNQRVTHSGGKNMKYYNIDENIACTAHKLVTYADWEAARSFEKAASPGDYVEERIIDEMRDCLPPACMDFGFLQMGEPHSHELDPDTGKWRPTFATFKKDGQHWTYCGNCFYKQDTPPKSERRH